MADACCLLPRCGETIISLASTSGRAGAACQARFLPAPQPWSAAPVPSVWAGCRSQPQGRYWGGRSAEGQPQRRGNREQWGLPPGGRPLAGGGLTGAHTRRAGSTAGGARQAAARASYRTPVTRDRAVACRAAAVTFQVDEDDYKQEAPGPPPAAAPAVETAPGVVQRVVAAVQRGLDLNEWVLRDFRQTVAAVRAWEGHMAALSDEQLKGQTERFRARLRGGATLEDLQAEAFATVREAARRTLGMSHFDVQVLGGAVLHCGAVAEMRTGEGKTLVSTLPAYLNALAGHGVHVITVNDYLAKRDAEWVGRVHRFLGLSVGLIQANMETAARRAAYLCDITYANNNEVGFDYLRDMVELNKHLMRHREARPFHFAIIDEVDSVLIDEGRNPLIISGPSGGNTDKYPQAAAAAARMVKDQHYKVKEGSRAVELLEEGVLEAEVFLGVADLWAEDNTWADFVVTAVRAKEGFKRDKDYIVKDGQVIIVDEFTGRSQPGRRYSDHLHQALEAKEGVPIQPEMRTIAEITHQAFFRLYAKLAGMTGTAKTEESEFVRVYKLPVVVVPTNVPAVRADLPLEVYPSARGKFGAVAREVLAMTRAGRPVLVGTTSVSSSEVLSDILTANGISHNLLNARPQYAALEAEIIAQAGRFGAITISTNMAGRGTDILLGGNAEMLAGTLLRKYLDPLLCPPGPEPPALGPEEEAAPPPVTQVLPSVHCSTPTWVLLAQAQKAARVVGPFDTDAAAALVARATELGLERSLRAHWERHVAAPHEMPPRLDALLREGDAAAPSGGEQTAERRQLLFWMGAAYYALHKDCSAHCKQEGERVRALGGLHVIGTQLHESRRVDNQLKGRAGRQGDPGSSKFMVSLDDDLMLHFRAVLDPTRLSKFVDAVFANDDYNIAAYTPAVGNEFRKLQVRMEKQHLRERRQVMDFDAVPEVQRAYIYTLRQQLLTAPAAAVEACMFQYMQDCVDDVIARHAAANQPPATWDLAAILAEVQQLGDAHVNDAPPFSLPPPSALLAELQALPSPPGPALALPPGVPLRDLTIQEQRAILARQARRSAQRGPEWSGPWREAVQVLRSFLAESLIARHHAMAALLPDAPVQQQQMLTQLLVVHLDDYWKLHLANLKRLRSAVSVRGFGQMNPLEEFRIEGCRLFLGMLETMRRNMVKIMVMSPGMRQKTWVDHELTMLGQEDPQSDSRL
ncbi:preprotein translocase [Klebsormidium nitens]|uniref:Protein translocase subunit SecA n=1 Tax=Klebsormidium nitens TaxID=105231 RepID=A0A1Y1I9Y0_KLENI|nr:preprotein translocase [Klebsormidium nitens]|eukprot:GAQ84908.1 preprotein translocase [Klebsormidium nitens]